MITGPENKNKQPLSLLSTNGDTTDTESLFNSLNFMDNLTRETKSPTKVSASFIKDTNSNPFVNFNLENSTNPFHESNPFLSPSNPFIKQDDVDGKIQNGPDDTKNNNKEVTNMHDKVLFILLLPATVLQFILS